MYNTIGIILQMLIAILLFWWLISKKEDTLEFQNFFDKLLIQMKRWNKFIKSITKEFINIELDNDFKVRNLIIQLLIAGTIWMIIQYVFWLNMWSLNWKLIIFIWWFILCHNRIYFINDSFLKSQNIFRKRCKLNTKIIFSVKSIKFMNRLMIKNVRLKKIRQLKV